MHSVLAVWVDVPGLQTLPGRRNLEAVECYTTKCTTENAGINTRLCVLLACFIDEPDLVPRAASSLSLQL